MNPPTLDRPPFVYKPARTLAAAIVVALLVEAGAALLLLSGHVPPVARPIAPLRVTHVVTIADAPPLPAPPPAPVPKPPPPHPEVPHKAPARPRLVPAPTRSPPPRPTEAAPAAAPAAAANVAPPVATAAAPDAAAPVARPAPNRPAIRRGVVPLTRIEPDYPSRAIADNIEGTVVADLTIDQDGHVSDVRIVRAQPGGVFEHAAEKALRQWKFSASDSGIVGEVVLNFTLN